MSDALEKIKEAFDAFSRRVDESHQTRDAEDIKDAYGRLNRLRERYLHEKNKLTPDEGKVLEKVFEKDTFIEGMMDMRQISEHVKNRQGANIRTIGNAPVVLPVETSAAAMFPGPIVSITIPAGTTHVIDHMERLDETKKRVAAAIANADKE